MRSPAALLASAVLALIVLACLLAPVYASDVAHSGPDANHITEQVRLGSRKVDVVSPTGVPIGPTWQGKFLLGADKNGRDVAVRLLYGGRNSLQIAATATAITIVAGAAIALIAGWLGGIVDSLLSRAMDLLWSYPVLLLGVALGVTLAVGGISIGPVTLHSGSLLLPSLIIGVLYIPYVARPLRGQVLQLRGREFVDAARQQGRTGAGIVLAEILPNLSSSIAAFVPLMFANSILLEAGLSFLGAGVQAPSPSWGTMIAGGTELMPAGIQLVLAPGLMLLATVLCANVLADLARDALDPRFAPKRLAPGAGGLDWGVPEGPSIEPALGAERT